jgi:signal transduction histidine kinase
MKINGRKRGTHSDQQGSALLVALMVMAGLSLLGLAFVAISETESAIAVNQRNYVQSQAAAEAGSDSSHTILVDAGDDLPHVLADLDQVRLVLTNLLSNARKYSPAGGAIHLHARSVTSPSRAPAVEIAVRDEGIGIPAEALPHLFGRFYRVDDAPHRAVPGTGLGLSICQRIVTAHGGRIWAESGGPGTGTTAGQEEGAAEGRASRGAGDGQVAQHLLRPGA